MPARDRAPTRRQLAQYRDCRCHALAIPRRLRRERWPLRPDLPEREIVAQREIPGGRKRPRDGRQQRSLTSGTCPMGQRKNVPVRD